MLTGADPALDPVPGRYQRYCTGRVLAVLLQNTLVFELHKMTRGCGWLAPPQGFGQKALGGKVSRLAEMESGRFRGITPLS